MMDIKNKIQKNICSSNGVILSKNIRIPFDNILANTIVKGDPENIILYEELPTLKQIYTQTSFCVVDFDAILYNLTAGNLYRHGYDVKIIDMRIPVRKSPYSDTYNPIKYCKNTDDIELIANTLAEFAVKEETEDSPYDVSFISRIFSYIYKIALEIMMTEHNGVPILQIPEITGNKPIEPVFSNLLKILNLLSKETIYTKLEEYVKKNDDKKIASCYKHWKTLKTFYVFHKKIIEMAILALKDIPGWKRIAHITQSDNLNLDQIGNKKTAIFIVTPTDPCSTDILTSLLIKQLYNNSVFYKADNLTFSTIKTERGDIIKQFRSDLATTQALNSILSASYKKADPTKAPHTQKLCYEIIDQSGEVLTRCPSKFEAEFFIEMLKNTYIVEDIIKTPAIHLHTIINDPQRFSIISASKNILISPNSNITTFMAFPSFNSLSDKELTIIQNFPTKVSISEYNAIIDISGYEKFSDELIIPEKTKN